jgi:hypothetical protein
MSSEESAANPGRHAELSTPGGTSYQWNIPGKATSVFIDYDVVDRLGFEIMRGFGAVPRRGAEVGGVLLGSAEPGDHVVIRVEDFETVECEHARGPSYLLSEKDMKSFDEIMERWAPAPDKRIYAVGFYRSHTRDELELTPQDVELLDARFPAPTAVCLLVKPYATRVSEAAFFVRDAGRFAPTPAGEVFPFRRKELGGGRPAHRPRGMDASPEAEARATGFEPVEAAAPPEAAGPAVEAAAIAGVTLGPVVGPVSTAEPEAPRSKLRSGWVWIPLSFVFLLLGVVLGFQIALSYRPPAVVHPMADPYQLDMSVVQFDGQLHLKWNPDMAIFQNARRGVLHIEDGDNEKTVDLRPEDLARGGVLYRNTAEEVTFRLEVFPRERTSITESVSVRAKGGPADDGKQAEAATAPQVRKSGKRKRRVPEP